MAAELGCTCAGGGEPCELCRCGALLAANDEARVRAQGELARRAQEERALRETQYKLRQARAEQAAVRASVTVPVVLDAELLRFARMHQQEGERGYMADCLRAVRQGVARTGELAVVSCAELLLNAVLPAGDSR